MNAPLAKNALLLVGGGARAAYQAGVLRSLAKAFPNLKFPILTGISAGAINAASLANSTEEFLPTVERTVGYWESITIDQVFRSESHSTSLEVLKWVVRMATTHQLPPFKGLLDTAPLRHFLRRSLASPDGILRGVGANIRSGRLSAFGIATAQYPLGRTTTWVQGENVEPWEHSLRCGKPTSLTVEHIMASTALPLVFPAIHLEDGWHGDGGLRLTSPLSPLVHLGADRVLAISTLAGPEHLGLNKPHEEYPALASVVSALLDSVFVDRLDSDAAKMRQINQLIADNPHSPEFGLRPVEVFVVRPSVDLGEIASEFFDELPRILRNILHGLSADEGDRSAIIATLLFQPRYIRRVIEIGEKDGAARRDEFAAFFGLISGTNPGDSPVGRPRVVESVNGHGPSAENFSPGNRSAAPKLTGTDN